MQRKCAGLLSYYLFSLARVRIPQEACYFIFDILLCVFFFFVCVCVCVLFVVVVVFFVVLFLFCFC